MNKGAFMLHRHMLCGECCRFICTCSIIPPPSKSPPTGWYGAFCFSWGFVRPARFFGPARQHDPPGGADLPGSGLLLAVNWLVYVFGMTSGFVVEASLGYFINPLVNVLLGMVFLRERLRPAQWLPIASRRLAWFT